MNIQKPIHWIGTSLDDLIAFPESVRRNAGYQLYRLQTGRLPDDWKPLVTIGKGVQEIRLRDRSGAYRIVYLACIEEAVYVLHAFQKKTQKTSRKDLNIARTRFKSIQQS